MNWPTWSRRRWLALLGIQGLAFPFYPATVRGDATVSPHVTSAVYSPDGRYVLAGSQAGVEVRVAADLSLAKTIQVEMDSVHDVRFSPDGRWLAVAGGFPGEFGSVAWIRWPSGELDRHVEVHDDVIHQVAFSADGTKWMTASSDEVCSVFAIDASKPSTRFTEHSRDVLGVAMLPDGETVVSGSRDETLRVWEAGSGKPIRTLHNHSRDVLAVALQPNPRGLPVVASASADLTIRFWQPTIGRMVRFARLPSTPLAIAWVFEGRLLAAACEDGNLRLVDPVKVSVLQSTHVGDDWLFSVAEHPQQSGRVVVGGAYGTLRAEGLRS